MPKLDSKQNFRPETGPKFFQRVNVFSFLPFWKFADQNHMVPPVKIFGASFCKKAEKNIRKMEIRKSKKIFLKKIFWKPTYGAKTGWKDRFINQKIRRKLFCLSKQQKTAFSALKSEFSLCFLPFKKNRKKFFCPKNFFRPTFGLKRAEKTDFAI